MEGKCQGRRRRTGEGQKEFRNRRTGPVRKHFGDRQSGRRPSGYSRTGRGPGHLRRNTRRRGTCTCRSVRRIKATRWWAFPWGRPLWKGSRAAWCAPFSESAPWRWKMRLRSGSGSRACWWRRTSSCGPTCCAPSPTICGRRSPPYREMPASCWPTRTTWTGNSGGSCIRICTTIPCG